MKNFSCILFIVCLLILSLLGCGKVDPANMSKEEYDQIKPGMTPSEVREIVGGSGQEIGNRWIGERLLEYKYNFKGERSGSATLIYEVDTSTLTKWRLIEKTEDNLK